MLLVEVLVADGYDRRYVRDRQSLNNTKQPVPLQLLLQLLVPPIVNVTPRTIDQRLVELSTPHRSDP